MIDIIITLTKFLYPIKLSSLSSLHLKLICIKVFMHNIYTYIYMIALSLRGSGQICSYIYVIRYVK